jgi:hypothetical protein
LTNKPGVVLYTCNPNYVGDIGRRIVVPGQPGQKVRLCLKNDLKEKGLEAWLK